jgi:hypothetical protein
MAIEDIQLKQSDAYLSNPNLKRANTTIEWTEEQIIEFMRCKEDPVYFAKNYIKIVSLDEGLIPFDLFPFQEKLIQRFHENRFNICKMPRQTGKCFNINTKVKVKNKDTGEILELTIGELYEKIEKENNSNMS